MWPPQWHTEVHSTCAHDVSAEAGHATSGHIYFTLQLSVSLNCDLYTPISCLFPVILHPESFPVSLNRAPGTHQGMWEHLLGCLDQRRDGTKRKQGEWKLGNDQGQLREGWRWVYHPPAGVTGGTRQVSGRAALLRACFRH